MTKLMEWLLAAGLFLGIWSAFITRQISHPILERNWDLVLYFPVIAVALFGIYALSVILWRVYNFNDCEDAARELKEQIIEARKDLTAKGFIFEETRRWSADFADAFVNNNKYYKRKNPRGIRRLQFEQRSAKREKN